MLRQSVNITAKLVRLVSGQSREHSEVLAWALKLSGRVAECPSSMRVQVLHISAPRKAILLFDLDVALENERSFSFTWNIPVHSQSMRRIFLIKIKDATGEFQHQLTTSNGRTPTRRANPEIPERSAPLEAPTEAPLDPLEIVYLYIDPFVLLYSISAVSFLCVVAIGVLLFVDRSPFQNENSTPESHNGSSFRLGFACIAALFRVLKGFSVSFTSFVLLLYVFNAYVISFLKFMFIIID